MPLGDVEASALQVTSGSCTRRCSTAATAATGRGSPRAGTSPTIGCGWRCACAAACAGTTTARSACSTCRRRIEPLLRKGNDAAALRAALADVASIELVTERTVRFVLKRPSDLVLRALCDVPILPDHIIRGVRAESAPIARAADRHRPVPVRGLGARQAHPPGTRRPTTGARRRASTRSCSTSTPTRCARSTERGAARSTCWRACSTSTTRSRSSRRRCTAARRSTGCRRAAIRSWSRTTRTIRCPTRASGARWRCCGTASGSRASCTTSWRARSADRRSADDVPRAAVRSPARDRAARGGRLPRQRRRRRARSARASRSG